MIEKIKEKWDEILLHIKKKYGLLIQITIEELTGIECEVDFVTIEQVDEPQKETDKSHLINRPSEVSRQLIQDANLNPRYTFDTFVVGKNNNLARPIDLGRNL